MVRAVRAWLAAVLRRWVSASKLRGESWQDSHFLQGVLDAAKKALGARHITSGLIRVHLLQGVQVDDHVDQGILVDDGGLAAQPGPLDTCTAPAVCAGACVPSSTAWLFERSSAVRCL